MAKLFPWEEHAQAFPGAKRAQKNHISFETPEAKRATENTNRSGFGTPSEKVDLRGISEKLSTGGVAADAVVKNAEAMARAGATPNERRRGRLELRAIELIRTGKLDKHAIERTPEVIVDEDNDCYRPHPGDRADSPFPPVKGEHLEEFRHFSDIPQAPPQEEYGPTQADARKADVQDWAEETRQRVREVKTGERGNV